MKLHPQLLKIIPLVTVVTGIVAPLEIANAAGSTTVNNDAHSIEEAATAKPHGDSHTEAAGAASHGDGHTEAAPLPPRLQQIEFFGFLGAIGLAIVIPELLYRPKRIAQNFMELENSVQNFPQEVPSKSEDTLSDKADPNLTHKDVQTSKVQLVEFGKKISEMVGEQITSISQESSIKEFPQEVSSRTEDTQLDTADSNLPNKEVQTSNVQLVEFSQAIPKTVEEQTLKIIPNDVQPHTIPHKKQTQFDLNGQIEIDNWSQPNRKSA